jgi:hypothetical protein
MSSTNSSFKFYDAFGGNVTPKRHPRCRLKKSEKSTRRKPVSATTNTRRSIVFLAAYHTAALLLRCLAGSVVSIRSTSVRTTTSCTTTS